MKKEIAKRISELRSKLRDESLHLSENIRSEIEEDLHFLEKLHHALYFY